MITIKTCLNKKIVLFDKTKNTTTNKNDWLKIVYETISIFKQLLD